jgi:serine/threonine protein kinase
MNRRGAASRHCPVCGHAFDSHDAPAKLCPRCLLLGALGDETRREPAGQTGATPTGPDLVHDLVDRILTLLIEDDLGTVYLAQRADRRLMTLRLVASSGDGAAVVRRLGTWRRQLADLADPRIVRIDAVGLTNDGRPFVVAEHVVGITLLRHAGRVEAVERTRLLDSVADAVSRAHRAGLVHGRLRSSNVLVVPDRDGASPRLLDFGMAPAVAGAGEVDPADDLAALDDLRRQVLAL